MISKRAVADFLRRKLRDSRLFKQLDGPVLKRKVKKLQHEFHTKPKLHQLACFIAGVRRPQYLFLLDMGLGKTLISLELLAYWKKQGKVKRALVLVPGAANVQAWIDECNKHRPDLAISGRLRTDAALDAADVYVSTYAGWLRLVCNTDKGTWRIDPGDASTWEQFFGAVVFDEITAAKNHRSLTFKACKRLAKTAEVRYGLTGTPFGRDPHDLWAQFFVVDGGETLGRTLGIFRAAFFSERKNYWGGYEYSFDVRKKKKLSRMLRHSSIHYAEKECIDLPKTVKLKRTVTLPQETNSYYNKIVQEIRDSSGNYALMQNAFVRMRQLTSGFLGVKDDETGERVEVTFRQNPKLDALMEWLDEVPANRKVVVFCEFIYSVLAIKGRLEEAGKPHVVLYSKSRDKKRAMQLFREAPYGMVMVSSSAGAYGLNLQEASYVFFYESPVSPIVRKQEFKRVRRMGQKRRTFCCDLVVKDSIDEKVLQYVEQGEDLFKAIVEGKEKL